MAMSVQDAVDNFARAMVHCDNIIAVHRAHGGGAMGRRYREPSLDRAVIVMAVAAWQAAVQDMTTALLDSAAPTGGAAIDLARYEANVGHARQAIGAFATPNAQNSRRLLQGAGFDPRPHWTWEVSAGRGRPLKLWRPADADARLDEWLRVRHAIAHGHAELPSVQALESVRIDNAPVPSIRLVDAEQCVAFVRRLVALSAKAIATHLGVVVTV